MEEKLAAQLALSGIVGFTRQYRFAPPRRWRIDFAWVPDRLAVEVQGEVHRIREQFHRDMAKIQALTLAGWRYLPLSSRDVREGRAVELIGQALG